VDEMMMVWHLRFTRALCNKDILMDLLPSLQSLLKSYVLLTKTAVGRFQSRVSCASNSTYTPPFPE
jgi:hypothetical protein